MSKLILKEIIKLKNQREVYLIKNAEGAFLYRKKEVLKYSVKLACRKISCSKTQKLSSILFVLIWLIFFIYDFPLTFGCKGKNRIYFNLNFLALNIV